jgi:hypothetical protein
MQRTWILFCRLHHRRYRQYRTLAGRCASLKPSYADVALHHCHRQLHQGYRSQSHSWCFVNKEILTTLNQLNRDIHSTTTIGLPRGLLGAITGAGSTGAFGTSGAATSVLDSASVVASLDFLDFLPIVDLPGKSTTYEDDNMQDNAKRF